MADPFLTYLTVFKSRLGLANLAIDVSGFHHQPTQAIERKLRQVLERKEELDPNDPTSTAVMEYLHEKKLVSGNSRSSGRYRGVTLKKHGSTWVVETRDGEASALPIFVVDRWMSDPALPSTIGVPTSENANEVVDFAFQLLLLSRAKNTWTAAAQTISGLRGHSSGAAIEQNPFILMGESPALLRQLIDVDGLIMVELLREVTGMGGRISRDAVAARFDAVVRRAVVTLRSGKVAPPDLKKATDFLELIDRTAGKRASMSRAPGVLEHRVSPRLEWLTDLGYLSKDGLQRNAFEYIVRPQSEALLKALDTASGQQSLSDAVAVGQWRSNPAWQAMRASVATIDGDARFRLAYRLVKRSIGPSPLREVAFIAAIVSKSEVSADEALTEVIDFAQATQGVSLSGGRYRRSPENIFMTDEALAADV